MPYIEDVLLWAIAQDAYPYVWGGESHAEGGFDCSGLVYAAAVAAGVKPRPPRTAYLQWQHCRGHKTMVPVAQALATRGALLFTGDGTGTGRDAITHVAFSLGGGTYTKTWEARGRSWGIGSWAAGSRFQYGALLPGADYSPGHGRFPNHPEDDMPTLDEFRTIMREELHRQWASDPTLERAMAAAGNAGAALELSEAIARKVGIPQDEIDRIIGRG